MPESTEIESVDALRLRLEIKKLDAEEADKTRKEAEKERKEAEKTRKHELEILRLKSHEEIQHEQRSTENLPIFKDGDNIEDYLSTFERLVTAYGWPEKEWVGYLAGRLSGKAREAFARMEVDKVKEYKLVKQAILEKFHLTNEEYRKKFRLAKKKADETFVEFRIRIQTYFKRWASRSEANTVEELEDVVVAEQLIETMPADLQIWIRQRQPKTSQEVADFAEVYVNSGVRREPYSSGTEHRTDLGFDQRRNTQERGFSQFKGKKFSCFACGVEGHVASKCPNRNGVKPKHIGRCKVNAHDTHLSREDRFINSGVVNFCPVRVLRDSGCSQTLVHKSLVESNDYIGKSCKLLWIDDITKTVPLAKVHLEVEGIKGYYTVGVVNKLDPPVYLGNDVMQHDYVARAKVGAVTRLQKQRREIEDAQLAAKMAADNPKIRPLEFDTPQVPMIEMSALNISNDQSEYPQGNRDSKSGEGSPGNIGNEQSADSQVNRLREFVKDLGDNETGFFEREGVLYRQFYLKKSNQLFLQLVVPKGKRTQIMQIAHSDPLAGHFGVKRTKERILRQFYWPRVFNDVKEYCKVCDACQKTAPRRNNTKAPLIPLPVIEVPFLKIGIDLIGPMVRSRDNNKFALTIVDFASRYPECIPLKSADAESVADALISFFCRMGIPQVIQHDQGTNFMSKLMRDLCDKLKIKQIRSSVFHPQTQGMVERFNGIIKSSLKKYVAKDPKSWDKVLPYVLFAMRDVPSETTGFSCFELLHTYPTRGPLNLLRDQYEGGENGNIKVGEKSVVEYALQAYETMADVTKLVTENVKKSQQRQKVYYDKTARMRHYKVGDQVLVLLPTDSNKLTAMWRGPFKVLSKKSDVNYETSRRGAGNRNTVFHVNMLKPYYAAETIGGTVQRSSRGCGLVITETGGGCETGQNDISTLKNDFKDVFNEVPGKTSLIECKLRLLDDIPVRKLPYRIPYKARPALKDELNKLLEYGIIRESNSPYAAPLVLVQKKNGNIRACQDFRELNKKLISDPYVMPRTDDLINKIAKAKYISCLDLNRAYHQIPLHEDSIEKTSFVTPWGQYEYKFLCFGLKTAGACFQRLMDQVLRGAEAYAVSYLDDIACFSDTWEDHIKHLSDVLSRIRQAGLTCNLEKCKFAQTSVHYLGYSIGQGKLTPAEVKVKAIRDSPVPKTKKQLKGFLGMVSYYRGFIKDLSRVAGPLYDKLKNTESDSVDWTNECGEAFNHLKNILSNFPVLRAPDVDQPYKLYTDASGYSIGCVLTQVFDTEEHPVLYLSRRLNKYESKYSTYEKEALAMYWAVKVLRPYLFMATFTVMSDHKPLEYIKSTADTNPRVYRWLMYLQQYDLNVEHLKGKDNVPADFLSRADGEATVI